LYKKTSAIGTSSYDCSVSIAVRQAGRQVHVL
jgi:hypothetical protein